MQAFEPTRFGQYLLLARLGRGGMAEVFRARREGLPGFERNVVVKRILAAHNEEPTFVQMLINEAKIAARLTHPNIVQVYELGENQGELFIAMELVEGKDLLALLRKLALTQPGRASLPPVCAAYIAREVCRGLAHAHEQRDEKGAPRPIIHRDISPQNIMLGFDGQVKVVDFGIAKALDGMKTETRTGVLKGKVAYLAPEQVSGFPPSPQSDIFAIGIVLHEMLTGRRLFKGPSEYDTLHNVRHLPVKPPSVRSPGVPRELDAIVLRALERDTRARYPRATEMARDLESCVATLRGGRESLAAFVASFFPDVAGAKTAPAEAAPAEEEDVDEPSDTPSLPLVVELPPELASSARPPRLIHPVGALGVLAAPVIAVGILLAARAAAPRAGVGGCDVAPAAESASEGPAAKTAHVPGDQVGPHLERRKPAKSHH